MKDLLNKIKSNEKTITAACRTTDGVEWTTRKVSADGVEMLDQRAMPLALSREALEPGADEVETPESLSEFIKGDVTVALRASDLLTRVMVFPTVDEQEIADMVGFQIDKVSPFPSDQLAIAHEILSTDGESSSVLMVAAKRDLVDSIGDFFEKRGVRIHSIDSRALGWLELIREEEPIPTSGCEIILIMDGIDFVLAVSHKGAPVAFRSLDIDLDGDAATDELVKEINYTLTMLDSEHVLPRPSRVHIWTSADHPLAARGAQLQELAGIKTLTHDLDALPPLSEGLLRRTLSDTNRIELIPREWIEHMNRQRLIKQFSLISGGVGAVWLVILLGFFIVFKVRDMRLSGAREKAALIAPLARQAEANQRKLKALRVYTDRSDSSLECLLEVTKLLPAGDIEFVSYGYDKTKGVTLRGTGRDKSIVTDFFTSLNRSELFDGIRNESVNDKTTKGVKRAVFSVTLPLARQEENQ